MGKKVPDSVSDGIFFVLGNLFISYIFWFVFQPFHLLFLVHLKSFKKFLKLIYIYKIFLTSKKIAKTRISKLFSVSIQWDWLVGIQMGMLELLLRLSLTYNEF